MTSTPASPARASGSAESGIVLLVQADPVGAARVRDGLDRAGESWPNHAVRHASSLRAALDAIDAEPCRCVLLGLDLPDAAGVQAVERILLSNPELPVVVLRRSGAEVTAAEALRAGAQDVLDEDGDLSPELLGRAVSYSIGRAETAAALVESNKALGAFAAMVAHDLRSPLAIATGMLDLLAREAAGTLPDQLEHLIDRSQVAIRRSTKIVDSLLMYSQARRPGESTGPIDLTEAAEWAAGAAGVAEVGGRVDLGPLPTVHSDTGGIHQVFQNLFANAVAYADDDHPPEVAVTATRDGDHWRITVVDDGPGILPEDRDRVFEEGERLGRHGDGLGLGLPAVRAVVERLGGRVWIEDPPSGTGTAVVFTIVASDDE